MHPLIMASILGALSALVVSPVAFRAARRWGILDVPNGWLKPHHAPVPRTGGLLIAASVLVGTPLALELSHVETALPWACLVGAALAFAVGSMDDARTLSPRCKFGLVVACAFVVVALGGSSRLTGLPTIDTLFSVFCLVGGANAMNLIDGLDALAGGLIAAAALFLALLAVRFGDMGSGLALMALLGGATVFLFFNRPPARIFLGDGGSLATGLFLAGIALHFARGEDGTVRLTAALLAFAVPILETASSIARRLACRRSPLDADRDHLYDILAQRLGDPRTAVLVIVLVGTSLAWGGLLYPELSARFPPAALGGVAAALAILGAVCGFRFSMERRHLLRSRRVSR